MRPRACRAALAILRGTERGVVLRAGRTGLIGRAFAAAALALAAPFAPSGAAPLPCLKPAPILTATGAQNRDFDDLKSLELPKAAQAFGARMPQQSPNDKS